MPAWMETLLRWGGDSLAAWLTLGALSALAFAAAAVLGLWWLLAWRPARPARPAKLRKHSSAGDRFARRRCSCR